MNKERIKAVRDLIASLPPERFDMRALAIESGGDFRAPDAHRDVIALNHDCGTAGCIAGWALALKAAKSRRKAKTYWDALDAREWLEINREQSSELFTPDYFKCDGYYTQGDAVATLDHLLETDEVKWPSKSEAA